MREWGVEEGARGGVGRWECRERGETRRRVVGGQGDAQVVALARDEGRVIEKALRLMHGHDVARGAEVAHNRKKRRLGEPDRRISERNAHAVAASFLRIGRCARRINAQPKRPQRKRPIRLHDARSTRR